MYEDDYYLEDEDEQEDRSRSRHHSLRSGFHYHGSEYALLYPGLIRFMGLQNAVFLTGITEFYNLLRERKKVGRCGQFFYHRGLFAEKWDLSPHLQRKAVNELSRCGLLDELDDHSVRNNPVLILNEVANFLYAWLINDMDFRNSKLLRELFQRLTEDEQFSKKIRRKLGALDEEYRDVRFPVDEGPCEELKMEYQVFKRTLEKAWKSTTSQKKRHRK